MVPYHVGDKVRITLTITAAKDMDYVELTDERSACLEPDNQLSGYAGSVLHPAFGSNASIGSHPSPGSNSLGAYREVRDTRTTFFIPFLPKGTHTITYDCHIDRAGTYALGIASAVSRLSDLTAAHSAGQEITVEPAQSSKAQANAQQTSKAQANAPQTSKAEANAQQASKAQAKALQTSKAKANALQASKAQANAQQTSKAQANAQLPSEAQANALQTSKAQANAQLPSEAQANAQANAGADANPALPSDAQAQSSKSTPMGPRPHGSVAPQSAPQSEADKLRAAYRAEIAAKNRPGTKAANFSFTTRDGKKQSLHKLKSKKNILLLFYDPDCDHCQEVIETLRNGEYEEKYTIMAIDTEEDRELWDETAPALPEDWTVGFALDPIQENETYVFDTMPTIYLLAPNKKVLLKEANLSDL